MAKPQQPIKVDVKVHEPQDFRLERLIDYYVDKLIEGEQNGTLKKANQL